MCYRWTKIFQLDAPIKLLSRHHEDFQGVKYTFEHLADRFYYDSSIIVPMSFFPIFNILHPIFSIMQCANSGAFFPTEEHTFLLQWEAFSSWLNWCHILPPANYAWVLAWRGCDHLRTWLSWWGWLWQWMWKWIWWCNLHSLNPCPL